MTALILLRYIGFIDGTMIDMGWPNTDAMEDKSFSGHNCKYVLKVHTVTYPDGKILHFCVLSSDVAKIGKIILTRAVRQWDTIVSIVCLSHNFRNH